MLVSTEGTQYFESYEHWRRAFDEVLANPDLTAFDIFGGLLQSLPYLLKNHPEQEGAADASLLVMRNTNAHLNEHWNWSVTGNLNSAGRRFLDAALRVGELCPLWPSPPNRLLPPYCDREGFGRPLSLRRETLVELADEACRFWANPNLHLWVNSNYPPSARIRSVSGQMLQVTALLRCLAAESEIDDPGFTRWGKQNVDLWQTRQFVRACIQTQHYELVRPTDLAIDEAQEFARNPERYLEVTGNPPYLWHSGDHRELLDRLLMKRSDE